LLGLGGKQAARDMRDVGFGCGHGEIL
jgi:hypothetical protein